MSQTSQLLEEAIPVSPAAQPGARMGVTWTLGLSTPSVALLTGGGDRPYALGMAAALTTNGVAVDFIGSNELDAPELRANALVNFLNLRGDQSPQASRLRKFWRVLVYYARLLRYAARARPGIFHILWNNKFELFDRTILLLYYKALGRSLVFTAHNVNARKRDGNDTWLNRFTLGAQYRLVDHIFVHTDMMKRELMVDFGVPEHKVTVIPFGINNTVPNTALTGVQARERLGLKPDERVLLCFGGITPYKGLEYAVRALALLVGKRSTASQSTSRNDGLPPSVPPPSSAPHPLSTISDLPSPPYRLVIAGKPKRDDAYWQSIKKEIEESGLREYVLSRAEYIPDEETEVYFKAADVLLLPYTHIFQSGVLFLGYSFGLPVIAADVGSLKEEIIEGKTGFAVRQRDSSALAAAVERYFMSELYKRLADGRQDIHDFAQERYSWCKVAGAVVRVYANAGSELK